MEYQNRIWIGMFNNSPVLRSTSQPNNIGMGLFKFGHVGMIPHKSIIQVT